MFISEFLLQRMFAGMNEECLSLLVNDIARIMNNYKGNTKRKPSNLNFYIYWSFMFQVLMPINSDALIFFSPWSFWLAWLWKSIWKYKHLCFMTGLWFIDSLASFRALILENFLSISNFKLSLKPKLLWYILFILLRV